MDSGELGHFSLLEKIGEGGMGRVYKARDTRLERLVAIKLLAEARRGDADRRARFIQEAKAASALNHPNIITIHEIGEHDGQTFIVMELVDGKPLNELIPRKGMRLPEALRIAAQVAAALTAAHAAGIVHRDLKPANLMVDAHGRVKVLDFGLAKLFAPAKLAAGSVDESASTVAMDQPVTEEGVVLGSVPYMSPEQAEGKPVDARSDIFSFGAVLYEMITGQRAFRGESRASTLAAIVEKDPPPPSEISPITPPELDRLVARCLRKDVNRRSQNMADVKLALEELRDEPASGKLPRPAAAAGAGSRRWIWPAVAVACALVAAAALTWTYVALGGTQSKAPALVRVSPDDGHSYNQPAISPDGGFVAYVSDRSGKDELWLQQVGGGDPIQLTHSNESVSFPSFFPDGKRIVYVTTSADNRKSTIEVISALGGDSQVLIQSGRIVNWDPILSPDGRQIAYFEDNVRLMTISSSGGQPRELAAWAEMPHQFFGRAAWTPDSRNLLCLMSRRSPATNAQEPEWVVFPVNGGDPVGTGAGDALHTAGLDIGWPVLMAGDRVLFMTVSPEGYVAWDIRLWPGSWRVHGAPHRLTFGTESEMPSSASSTGALAVQVGNDEFNDLYLIPLSPVTGQPAGGARRFTQDRRYKYLLHRSGLPGYAYFRALNGEGRSDSIVALDLDSGRQALMTVGLPLLSEPVISPDGRRIAYSKTEGDSYSIVVRDSRADPAEARVLCQKCGRAAGFSPDGRFILYDPEAKVQDNSKRKSTVRLLEVASGKDRPWLEHPSDSVVMGSSLGEVSGWLDIRLTPPGPPGSSRRYLVRWTEEAIPQSAWIEIKAPARANISWRVSPTGDFFYYMDGLKLMAARLNPLRTGFGDPHEVEFLPGIALKPGDDWTVRGPGLVLSRPEATITSVWLMKLPR